jgi:HK97 family phage prohead protease/HK97 family phage major capsid protein
MPIKPHKGETQDAFVSRCMHELSSADATERPQDQKVAICMSAWRDAHGGTKPKQMEMMPDDDEDYDDYMERCQENGMSEEACQSMWDESNGEEKKAPPIIHKVHSDDGAGFDFVLSDATPDRFGDVIMADGWNIENFKKNPVALFNHLPTFPVGRWVGLHVKDGALKGRLEFAPLGTSPRIDEIRKLVEAGILRAVSVGFRPIESKPRGKSADGVSMLGELFLKSELLEASVVAIGANPNALAIAKSLKISDDTLNVIFAKHGKEDTIKRRGSNGKHAETSANRKSRPMTTLTQRIEELQKTIVKDRDDLDAHLKTTDDDSADEASQAISDEMSARIAKNEKQLESLKRAETALALKAKEKQEQDGNGKGTELVVRNARPFAMPAPKIQPMDHMWRALTVAVKHFGEGRQRPILDVLRENYGENDVSEMTRVAMANFVTKSASVPADTVTTGWAKELVQTIIGDLIPSLLPFSVYPGLATKGGSFTFGRNGVVSLPARNTGAPLGGAFVAQGAPIPVKQGAFTAINLIPKKMGVITTMTRNIMEHSTPAIEAILRQAILEDTGVAIDTVLLDATSDDTTRPAGIRYNVSATSATAGGGMTALSGDLRGLTTALLTGTLGNVRAPVWIMAPGDVLAASLTQSAAGGFLPFRDELARGTLLGYPVLQTTTGTNDMMYLLDAADFITATGDTPRFDVSDQAVLYMESAPGTTQLGTAGTPATISAPARSLWQTDVIGIRMILDINWAMRRTGVVAWTQTMTWN